MRARRIAGMRVAYIHVHITKVQPTSAMTGSSSSRLAMPDATTRAAAGAAGLREDRERLSGSRAGGPAASPSAAAAGRVRLRILQQGDAHATRASARGSRAAVQAAHSSSAMFTAGQDDLHGPHWLFSQLRA